MRPEGQLAAREIAAETADDIGTRRKDASGVREPAGVSTAPLCDRFGDWPALVIAKPGQATVTPRIFRLTAITAAGPDQIDARAYRMVVVNRQIIRDAAIGQCVEQGFRQPERMMHVRVHGLDLSRASRRSISRRCSIRGTTEFSGRRRALPRALARIDRGVRRRAGHREPRSAASRSLRCRSVPPPQRWLISRKTARSSWSHGENRIRRTRDRSATRAETCESFRLAKRTHAFTLEDGDQPTEPCQPLRSRPGRLRKSILCPRHPWCGTGATVLGHPAAQLAIRAGVLARSGRSVNDKRCSLSVVSCQLQVLG